MRDEAGKAVALAIKKGWLVKPASCQACDQRPGYPLHGHHHRGYARADHLNVLWLCRECHHRAHHPELTDERREALAELRGGGS